MPDYVVWFLTPILSQCFVYTTQEEVTIDSMHLVYSLLGTELRL
jgi:hypothetical protein